MIKIYRYSEVNKDEIFSRTKMPTGVEDIVRDIIDNVKANGDKALLEYNRKFDKADTDELEVSPEEIQAAYDSTDPELIQVMEEAAQNIRDFHSHQKRNSFIISEKDGIVLGQKVMPIQRAGVYVPGGTAAYPSTVLMDCIPAKIAGCEDIIITTPATGGNINPVILAAAKIAGVTHIYRVGGAQAVAALAYGTETIPKVDKIVGPGNAFVAEAKKQVFGEVAIDMVAGPSEILVIADGSCDPVVVAADMLSQAEHDELASATLVTTSQKLAEDVDKEIKGYLPKLSREEIISKSLENYGHLFVAETKEDAIAAVNQIASEHLEIVTADPFLDMTKIKNAGAIFLGTWSSEPLGDYFAGPNHVLPTNGTAKFFSALCVDDFIKKSSVISYSREALEEIASDIEDFAECEKLTAHANSIRVRFEK